MIFLQWYFTNDNRIAEYGFYPANPLRNLGINAVLSVFLHGGWLHLIFNAYFAFILSDDVEEDLGWKKYVGFLLFVIGVSTFIQIFISYGRDIPHVGYSGVVMALFAYYAFQFPKAKLVWLLPRMKTYADGGFRTWLTGWGWYQFPILWCAALYFLGDLAEYFFTERNNTGGGVAHSAHIAGFIAGYLFWKFFAVKTFNRSERDVFENYMDRLVQDGGAKDVNSSAARVRDVKRIEPPKK
ncbi:MAG: rhomboid family intramembrane serine protease [Bdellovibrionia bacterium]